jgi:hypothetical protein
MVLKAGRVKLRPAADVRQEVTDQADQRQKDQLEHQLSELAKKIENHKEKGLIWVQSLHSEIVAILRSQGYTVTYYNAAHSGDVDSHKIEW